MGGCNSLLTGLSFCIFTASPPPTHNLYSTYKMEARANLLKHTACHTSLLLKILPWLPILFRVETKVLTVDSQTLYLFILSPIILSFVHHSPSSLACFLSLRHAKKTPVSGLCTCCFLCLYLLKTMSLYLSLLLCWMPLYLLCSDKCSQLPSHGDILLTSFGL